MAIFFFAFVSVAAILGTSCATAPPPRHVLERDLDGFAYRRYQKVLDVEFPVAGNPAVGHTATYVRRRGDGLETSSAFVTVYERPSSLAAEIRDRVRSLATYESRLQKVAGEWVWKLDGGADQWVLWVSGSRVIKVGAPGASRAPEVLAEEYLDLYPSDLDERGAARADAASAGPSRRQEEEEKELRMPRHLREGHDE